MLENDLKNAFNQSRNVFIYPMINVIEVVEHWFSSIFIIPNVTFLVSKDVTRLREKKKKSV